MLDLAIITAGIARDRVADQFAVPAVPAATRRGMVRRAAVGALRRRGPAPRTGSDPAAVSHSEPATA